MQGGQGRGSRPGYPGRGGAGRGGGMPMAALGYAGMPGFLYNGWGGYNNYHMQGLFPAPPPMRPPHARGSTARPFAPLGVQGAGILKRPAGPSHGPLIHGRGHTRGHGGRAWGGRTRKYLTKEALDADLDEWRMKDKKFGGQSLDADLDEYWKKKFDDDEAQKPDVEVKDEEELGTEKGANRFQGVESPDKSSVAAAERPVVSHNNSDEEKLEEIVSSPPDNGVNV